MCLLVTYLRGLLRGRVAAVELRITLEAFGTAHKQEIIDALHKNGYKPKVVRTNI